MLQDILALIEKVWDYVFDIHHQGDHISYVFPDNTNLTCTLTALNTANTFSAWAEIEDNTGGTTIKLSSKFATYGGHITDVREETLSEINTLYELELAYGDGGPTNLLTVIRFAGGTKFDTADNDQHMNAPRIPAGSKVYYRMKTATAVADTCLVHLRYHLHEPYPVAVSLT